MRNNITWISPTWYIALLMIFSAIVLATLLFSVMSSARQSNIVPQTNTVLNPIVTSVAETNTIRYIEIPLIETDSAESVQQIPTELRNFSNLDELKRWLDSMAKTTITVYLQQPGEPSDCDDFAIALQKKALSHGYIISFQIISFSEYNRLFSNQIRPYDLHAVNLAIIGNDAYYIEPQTGEVVLAAHLD